jgi:hypothetical protein
MDDSLLNRLKRFDDARPSFPAEHWLAFGAAIWLLTRSPASPFGRLLSVAAGLALVYRAASGRDGLVQLWNRKSPFRVARRTPGRYIDTMEPYSRRVRVSAISEPIGNTALMR